jgi:serine phosphatase RsbU (regulator of sigma subunit)
MVRDYEVRVRKKGGAEIDVLLTATLQRAGDGAVLGMQGIIRDITAQKQAEQERLRLTAVERELTLARNIQQSLLPPPTPDWYDLDVVCYNMPARVVGGDLYVYHAFAPPSGAESARRYAIAVGDVSGKGMPAALLMAVSLASFRSIVRQGPAPSELLAQMDRALADYTGTTRQNCALVYVEIAVGPTLAQGEDPQEGRTGFTLRAANAGCIWPLIRRADGSVEWLEIGGMPLGVEPGAEAAYQEASLNLAKGDMVILTSDGVIESNNAARELFGFERLERAVASAPTASAKAMLTHLRAEVAAYTEGVEPHDDLTLVVVQI